MIGIVSLSKSFGADSLFEDVSLQLNAGSRYGLVGANGSGKTTFLKILTGDEPASGGEVNMPKHARVGVLRQDRFQSDEQRVIDVAMMGDEVVWGALCEQTALGEASDPDPHRMSEVDELIRAYDGYTLESRAAQVLVGLGIQETSLKKPLGSLSGGYKLRVLLAQVLVSRPEVLLLDEPTNHLDILSIQWLENFLVAYRGCVVVISHDHRFLNRVATHILDVDYETVTPYTGNYDAFVTQKLTTRDRKETEIARTEKIIAEKEAFVERFRAKATKARQAQSRVKQLEKIEVERLAPTSRRYPTFRFDIARPSGRDVLTIEGLDKAFGDKKVLVGVDVSIRRGERVAIIGANGLGKSTLLKIATGNLQQDAGKCAWGHEAHVGYFAQDHKDQLMDPAQTALEFLWAECTDQTVGYVRGILGKMLFSGDDVHKKLASLSGGEAARLIFSRLMVEKPNVLVLDEPTNHLDIEAIDALLEALEAFEGTLILVSHDRYFVSRLATRIIELRPNGLNDFQGTYDEYLGRDGADHLNASNVVLRKKEDRKSKASKSLSPSRRPVGASEMLREMRDSVLLRVAEAEATISGLHGRYAEPGFFEQTERGEILRLKKLEEDAQRALAGLVSEWEELEAQIALLDG